jgi:Zn-dependent protease with chaperone function
MIGLSSGALTGALLAAIWQGILLAALVGLGLRLLPKTPAAVRFAIWFGVFLVVTALPLASLWPRAAGSAVTSGHGAWLTLDARWSLAIGLVWLMASAVRAVTLVVAGFRVRALWRRATPVEVVAVSGLHPTHGEEAAMDGAPELSQNSELLKGAAYGRRRAQLCVSDEVDRPTVIGFFAPKILIPAWLLEKLTAAELEQIVLHEAGHLGRADDWMNLLQKFALVVFPLNPALAWVERRLCFERELAVDERVLRAFAGKAGAAKAYAACLATLAEYRMGRRGVALAIGALGRESELGRRVGRILRRGELMRPVQAKLVLGGAMLGLLGVSAGLERCPQVIGFAPSAGTKTIGLADVRTDATLSNGFGYRAVVYHPIRRNNGLQQRVNVAHESLPSAPMVSTEAREIQTRDVETTPVKAQGAGSEYGMRATLLKANAERPGSGSQIGQGVADGTSAKVIAGARMHAVSMVSQANGQAGDGVVRWLVVTSWQSADGTGVISSVVMTTDGTQASSSGTARTASDGAAAQPSQQVHPYYAALPVRDGWLVFQL